MNKYFLSYAGGGCLSAIALSSFLAEISRLIPVVWQWWIVCWAIADLFFIAWVRWKEDDLGDEYPIYCLLFGVINAVMIVGVCLGQHQ